MRKIAINLETQKRNASRSLPVIGSHVFCVEKLQLNEQKFELQQSLKAKYAFNII